MVRRIEGGHNGPQRLAERPWPDRYEAAFCDNKPIDFLSFPRLTAQDLKELELRPSVIGASLRTLSLRYLKC